MIADVFNGNHWNTLFVLGVLQMGSDPWRVGMMWKPLKFIVSSSVLGQNWLAGGNGSNDGTKTLPCIRQEHDGWVDFYIGNAQISQIPCQSILDGSVKVGLHYYKEDLDHIALMHCPFPDIPRYLWRSLQEQDSL